MEDLKKQVKNPSDTIESLENRIEDAANNQGATIVDPIVTTLLERMSCIKEVASKIITDDERSSDSTLLQTSKSTKLSIDEAAELVEKEKIFDRPVANVDFSKFLGVKPIPEFEDFESRVLVSNQIVTALKDSSMNMVELRTLCLDGCELSDITVIGELPMLQALSLVGSSIRLVPKEIGDLGSTLKLLDLRDCKKLEMIASGVISRLTLLEDLRIGDSCKHWKRLLEGNHKRSNIADETNEVEMASMEEFKNLQNLINLEIYIHDHTNMFPKDLVFTMLETFKITFGFWWSSSNLILVSPRTLMVGEWDTIVDFDSEGSKALITRAESLLISRSKSCISVSEMDPKGFPELKQLDVQRGEKIQYIVTKNYRNCIFRKLETLEISDSSKLKRICDDHHHPLLAGSFENLRILDVRKCANLKDLFSSYLTRRISSLKEINIEQCDGMESIIVSREIENEEETIIGFTHQLRVLKLSTLPRLRSFCNFKQIEGHPSPTHLFSKKIMFPELQVLELKWMTNKKIWDDHLAITAEGICWLQNLTSVEVFSCHNLKYVFTSSVVNSLAQLKQLKVYSCESIEEIVASTERATAEDIQLSFPKLDNLRLEYLPNLKRFCQANLLECQLLRELLIDNCSKLKTFVSANDSSSLENSTTLFTEKIAFPNLEKLRIFDCNSLEKVFDVQRLPMNECIILPFQNLQSVVVLKCQSLTSIIPTSLILACQQLELLTVRSCDKLDLLSFNNIQLLNDAFAKDTSSLKIFNLESIYLKLRYQHQRFILKIAGSTDFEVPPIFFALLQSSPKLDRVVVSRCSIIRLFPCGTDRLAAHGIDIQAKTLRRLPLLELADLSYMKHIWSEDYSLKFHVIPEVLELKRCRSLRSLAPPSATLFKNLTGLAVCSCSMLIKLVESSATAKSLANLKEMSVRYCGSLEEIVVIDDDQLDELTSSTRECIVFDKLEVLKLVYLDSLTSFCSTCDCNFGFPSLNRVVVAKCPKMKFFCKGDVSTPKVTRVEVEVYEREDGETEARWEGDLNSTIRQMFEESEKKEEEEKKREEEEEKKREEEEEEYKKRKEEEENFGLDSLPPNEAQNLFDKWVGGDSQYSNWPLTAQQLIDRCRGIPFLLTNLGIELQNQDESYWEEVLTCLKQFDEQEDFDEETCMLILNGDVQVDIKEEEEDLGFDSLPPDEAQNLFDRKVGGNSQYSNWPLTAQQVIDRCRGIPVLLSVIGRALQNEDESTWEEALTYLKQFDGKEDFDEETCNLILKFDGQADTEEENNQKREDEDEEA